MPGASSPSASSRPSRRPATATSCRAQPSASSGVHAVKSFVEKPDAATAARYVRDGYLWNSGNFLFRADVLLSELARLEPEMAEAIEAAVAKASTDLGFLRLQPEAFARAPQKSIDYAVMEKTDRAAVVAGDFRWSDIGSWDALFDITPRDAAGNVVQGPVVTMDAQRLRGAFRRPAHRRGRRQGPGGGEHVRRGDGGAARARAGSARTGRQAQGRQTSRGDRPQARAPAVGLLRVRSTWASASRSSASSSSPAACCRCRSTATAPSIGWWCAAPPRSPSAIKIRAVHENELVYIPIGSVHRHGQPGKDPARIDRGADRQLSRRRRHRAHRGYL